MKNIHISSSAEELSAILADYVTQVSSRAISKRGRFTIALSGGSALEHLARGLVALSVLGKIEWSAWQVFWVDERCVPWNNPNSNYATAKIHLFRHINIPEKQIHPIATNSEPEQAAREYAATLAKIFLCGQGHPPRFDLILLGIGEDGHIASLFPNHPLLQEKKRWVAPVFDSPKPPAKRITLTLPIINNAKNIAFAATGKGKAAIVAAGLSPGVSEPMLPVQMVRPAKGGLFWFLDSDSAANLGEE